MVMALPHDIKHQKIAFIMWLSAVRVRAPRLIISQRSPNVFFLVVFFGCSTG
jgi:hypothetical protein